MPFRLAIVSDKNLIYLIAEGFITDGELYGCVRTALESPAYQKGMNVCLVVDEEAQFALRSGIVKRRLVPLIGRYRRPAERYRPACVVFTEENEFALDELFRSLPQTTTGRFVHDLEKALSWLGHPLPVQLHMRHLGEAKLCGTRHGFRRRTGNSTVSRIH